MSGCISAPGTEWSRDLVLPIDEAADGRQLTKALRRRVFLIARPKAGNDLPRPPRAGGCNTERFMRDGQRGRFDFEHLSAPHRRHLAVAGGKRRLVLARSGRAVRPMS